MADFQPLCFPDIFSLDRCQLRNRMIHEMRDVYEDHLAIENLEEPSRIWNDVN